MKRVAGFSLQNLTGCCVSATLSLALLNCSEETGRASGLDVEEEKAEQQNSPVHPLGGAPAVDDLNPGANGVSSPYPDGPYAGLNPEIGDVIENLKFFGYVATGDGGVVPTRNYLPLSLEEIRAEGSEYLLIHISAIWCETCHVAASRTNDYVPEIRQRGGDVLELVVDGQATGADPRREDLQIWVELEDLTMSTVGPGDERVRSVFRDREFAYIIHLETMKVVWRSEGLSVVPTPAEQGAQELLANWLPPTPD